MCRLKLVNCFKKAGISSDSQFQIRSDDDDPFKLLAGHVDELKENFGTFSPPVDFTVEGYFDTDEIQALTDAEIIAQVTQSADLYKCNR